MKFRKLVLSASLMFVCATSQADDNSNRPHETVTPNFMKEIPNIPGKSLVAAVVTYPPNGASPSHHHAKSAFIYAYILEGEIRSSVDGSAPKIYKVGESFYEVPGSHHAISENASKTKPAKLLAVFVVDSEDKKLTLPDGQ
ncbi:cupin domain-containing protein [Pseudomonas rustica]|uniref:cupin domain-containing protein n=1 Tax=Pseudomonas rustica TaxID=2827099 RepID=UPI003CF3DBCB